MNEFENRPASKSRRNVYDFLGKNNRAPRTPIARRQAHRETEARAKLFICADTLRIAGKAGYPDSASQKKGKKKKEKKKKKGKGKEEKEKKKSEIDRPHADVRLFPTFTFLRKIP